MKLRALVLVILAGSTAGCRENEDGPRVPVPIEEGGPCHSVYVSCVDEDHRLYCADRTWVVAECTELCAAQSPAYVGGVCDDSTAAQSCACELADPQGCTPGEFRCTDAETLGKCDDAQQWVEHACADLCPEGQPSLGCAETPVACRCGL